MLKTLFVFLLFSLNALACPYEKELADSIYWAEGGPKAKVPYGVLSIKVHDEAHARQITLNSIRANWSRWQNTNKSDDFVTFMANHWVPESADYQGHKNWIKNVKALLKKRGIDINN